MVPHWAVDSQVAAQVSYLTPARYTRIAPIATKMGVNAAACGDFDDKVMM